MPAPLAIEPLPAAPVKCVGEQALKNCISVFKARGTLENNTHGYLHAGVIVATSRNIETTQSRHSKTKLITERNSDGSSGLVPCNTFAASKNCNPSTPEQFHMTCTLASPFKFFGTPFLTSADRRF